MDAADILARVLACLALILVAGRIAAILCRRIGFPVVIGELLAGIALGPSLFGLLLPDLWAEVFPPEVIPFLNLISQLGLVLFMFLIGLELDIDVIRRSGRRAATISLSAIALPFLLGSIVLGSWLHPDHDCAPVRDASTVIAAEDVCVPTPDQEVTGDPTVVGYTSVDKLGFSLFIGLGMAGTAFAILARILAERNMFRIPIGITLVACAAIDDVVAFTLLAVILSIITGGSVVSVLSTLGLLAAFVAVLIVLVRPLSQRLIIAPYQRNGKLLPEHLGMLLAGLFGAALVTQVLGMGIIIGSFLFGAVIPRPHGASIFDEVAEKLDTIASTLLLPVFFVIAGQGVRIDDFAVGDVIPLLAIIATASVGKIVGGSASARLTGVPKRQALAVGALMNTRGMAEIVILQLARERGIIDDSVFTMFVIMAIVTTSTASPLMRRVYPDRWLARDIAEAERRRASTTTDRVVVLVPEIDAERPSSTTDEQGLANALDLAVAYGASRPSCQVTLLHMVSSDRGLAGVAEAMGTLRDLQRRVEAQGPSCQVVSRAAPDTDAAVLGEIERLAPDAVVMVDPQLAAAIVDGGTDVLVADPAVGIGDVSGGLQVRSPGGRDEPAAVEVAARLALHLGVPLSLDGAGSGRTRRELTRLGVRFTGSRAGAHVAAGLDEGGDATVVRVRAGNRDRAPIGERLQTWQDVAPVVPLTTL